MAEAVKAAKGKITLAALFLLLGVCVGVGAVAAVRTAGGEPPAVITGELIGERLAEVRDLVSVEYYYKDVSTIDKAQLQVLNISIPFTGSQAIFSYEGVIRYGVDVGAVGIEVAEAEIRLTIPRGKIISHEAEDGVHFFDEGRNVFNPVTPGNYVEKKAERKAAVEAEAEERGFPAMAQRRAGETLRAFLEGLPGLDDYTIVLNYT